jgi:nucleotide-binding universal stress UspA family protein
MEYRTILTAAIQGKDDAARLEPAIAFAEAHSAHLEALCYGIDHAYPAYHYGAASLELMQRSQDQAREEAMTLRKAATAVIEGSGVEGTARAVVAGLSGIADVLADRGRLADLAVLTQAPEDERPRLHEMVIEGALFAAHLPVLLVPRGGTVDPRPARIAVGWDDGPEALAAIRGAMPLLRTAEQVDIVIVDPPRHSPERPDPGHDVSVMLSRHGVKTEVVMLPSTLPRISDMLLRHATDSSAGLLVMGAYGHSRFQETVFGGTTRRMLAESDVPLLMAH